MDHRTEPIRQDIDTIRDSMTDKMEQIESRVKGTVDDTVETVRRTFDIRQQVDERPWTALGAAVLAGYVLGSMGDSEPRSPSYQTWQPSESHASHTGYTAGTHTAGSHNDHSGIKHQASNVVSDVMDQFSDELSVVKTAAVAAAMSMLRDAIKQHLPQVGQEYERLLHDQNRSAGGAMRSTTSGTANTPGMQTRSVGQSTEAIPTNAPTHYAQTEQNTRR
jgi:hypothetical protein